MDSFEFGKDQEVLVGLDTPDDAAVYRLGSGKLLVQTVDFFTPVVNDPYLFGQIAAANALSDIYAMGGRPLVALNIVAFPCRLDFSLLTEILRGGKEKIEEGGAFIIGGHSVDDDEPKYGLAVTGEVEADKLTTIEQARPGDKLVLTKPLGLGILATALKADFLTEEDIEEAISNATFLNKGAAEAAARVGVKAVTDITGFGLLGHLYQMVKASKVGAEVSLKEIPYYKKSVEFIDSGITPAGLHDNRRFLEEKVEIDPGLNETLVDLLFDPQTSGGLLIAVSENKLNQLLEFLKGQSPVAKVVGQVVAGDSKIRVKS